MAAGDQKAAAAAANPAASQAASQTASQTASQAHGPDALSWICLGALVAIWGSTFAAISIGVETIAPVWLVAGRMVVAAMFLGAWLGVERLMSRGVPSTHEGFSLRALGWYSIIGVAFTALPFTLYAIAAESVPSAVLAICNGGTPFCTALLAHLVISTEKLTARRTAGVALGFLGLVILVWPDLQAGASARLSGLILAIVGAALYAGSNVMTRLAPPLSPVAASLVMIVSGGLATLAIAPFVAPFPEDVSLRSLSAAIFLGLLPTGYAFILYVWLVRRAGSVFTAFVTYLSPLWATGVGMLFLGETLRWTSIAALLVILAGVAVANLRLRRRSPAG